MFKNANNPFVNYAEKLLQSNPNISNNPLGQNLISILQNGDSKRGEEIARNLCQTYGISPEEAYNDAVKFFGGK